MLLSLLSLYMHGQAAPVTTVHHGTVDDRRFFYRNPVRPGAEAIALMLDDEDMELFLQLSRQPIIRN